MDPVEIGKVVQRLRRDFPRHVLILSLCDAVDQLLVRKAEPSAAAPFDKKAYQRGYMRKWRTKPVREDG